MTYSDEEVLVIYSSDISFCNFSPKLKGPLRGIRFFNMVSVLRVVVRSYSVINNQYLANDILRFPDIWQQVLNFDGGYIEGM